MFYESNVLLYFQSVLPSENTKVKVESAPETSEYILPDTDTIEIEESVIGDSNEYLLEDANTIIKEEFIVPDSQCENVVNEVHFCTIYQHIM